MNILKSLLIICGLLAIIGGTTYAQWRSTANLDDNVFQTGKISIATTPDSALFNVTGIMPGWQQTGMVTVTNNGSLPLSYQLSTAKQAGYADFFESPYLLLKVGTSEGGNELYDGPMSTAAAFVTPQAIDAGGSQVLYFTAALASDAPSSLQDTHTTVKFIFSTI